MRQFVVFNRAQIDGLPNIETIRLFEHEPTERIEELLRSIGARIHYGGDEAFYDRRTDSITVPNRDRFDTEGSFYGTLLHEHTHWTGAAHRLNREFGKRFGDEAYAFEELVAELGAAFACAELGVAGRLQHAEYLAGYAKVLRARPNALWTAASQASLAADFLLRSRVDAVAA